MNFFAAKTGRWLRACVALTVLCAAFSAHAYFRYVDENGDLVLSQTIPNERVRFGYDIVDQHGNLIERVPPQLSDEAYQEKLRRDAMQTECQRFYDRVHKLYQGAEDIDYAEEQAMKSLDNRVANTRANLAVVQSQRQEFESTAAQLDVSGKSIPATLFDNIQRASAQEKNFEDELKLRDQERRDLREQFAYDRKVFVLENCENGLPPRSASATASKDADDAAQAGD